MKENLLKSFQRQLNFQIETILIDIVGETQFEEMFKKTFYIDF